MSASAPLSTDRFWASLSWAGGALAAAWVVMSFTYPFGWDQGLFSWVGGAIVRGGLPYRDAWDFKGPLLYYLYALAQVLFGVHLWSIRTVDATLLGLATMAVFRTTRALSDQRAAQFAAILFVLWYGSHSYWHTAQPDGWAGMLLIIGVAQLISTERATAWRIIAAGFCFGLVVLLKPLWLAFIALPISYCLLSRRLRRAQDILLLLGAWVLPTLLTLGWFASQGSLQDLIDVHLRYSAIYAGLASDGRLRHLAEYFLANRVTTVSLPLVIYGLASLWKRQQRDAFIFVLWIAITVMLVSLQGRFYAYHWLPMLPAMTALVAIGVRALAERVRPFGKIAAAIILLSCAAPILLEAARFLTWRVGAIDRYAYYDGYGEPGADVRAVDWLKTKAGPGKVFGFGFNCGVPWLAGRDSVSRFCYALPLMMGQGTTIQSQYRAEALAALAVDPPRYIIVGTLSQQILGAELTIADFAELQSLLQRRYHEVARFGAITIFEMTT
jgi:4-amino-4-deoxy-L-arabinose transferase-like glycosyltransferase